MSRSAEPEAPSALMVLVLGILMSGSFGIEFDKFRPAFGIEFDEFQLAPVSLRWFLPLLAAWLAHRHGLQVLRAWWPLAFIPTLTFPFKENDILGGDLVVWLKVSTHTWLLALFVAAAVDQRVDMRPLEQWLRPGAKWPAIVAFCLLVVDATAHGIMQFGSLWIELFAIVPALVFLGAIRWEVLVFPLLPRLGRRPAQAMALFGAAVVLSGIVLDLLISAPGWRANLFSFIDARNLVSQLCFGLVACSGVRVGSISAVLLTGLAIDRLLAFAIGDETIQGAGESGIRILLTKWALLDWGVLFDGMAAAVAGLVFRHFFRNRALGPEKVQWRLGSLLLVLVVILFGSPLLSPTGPFPSVSALWIMAAIAFAAGVQWRERSLVFVVPFLQFLWLLAVAAARPRLEGSDPAMIGMLSFPFAFCGTFFTISKTLSPVESTTPSTTASVATGPVAIADLSALAKIVEQIDRSTTWRSFFVAAAPFVVLWQLYEIYGLRIFAQEAAEAFGHAPLLEDWQVAAAVFLALAPLAFVLWDWIDRRDSLRMLALVTGSAAGGLFWLAFGQVLGEFAERNYIEFEYIDIRLRVAGLSMFFVILLGSGLLAEKGGRIARIARYVFLATSTLAVVAAVLVTFAWLWEIIPEMEHPERTQVLAFLAFLAIVLLVFMISRFIRLRLLLAGDRPRELLFGPLRDKGFWARMAAAAGLPSSLWRRSALRKSAFWALFSARFVVYTGIALSRYWALTGAVLGVLGHLVFQLGKRLGAREIWRPRSAFAADRHILFLRGFDDDQCEFRRPQWNLLARWLDLWSFRRNLDEAMIDEVAQFGPVVALGRPGDKRSPFGAMRHYAADADWQRTLAEAARSAQAIVLVASDSAGVQWEYDLLKREGMLDKVLLVFRPRTGYDSANRHAAEWFCAAGGAAMKQAAANGRAPIGITKSNGRVMLITAGAANAAAYVLALRLYFYDRYRVMASRRAALSPNSSP